MLGQRVAAESLYRVVLGELHNPQQISLQVRPRELRFAGMILQVRAETAAAQHALKDGSQQTDQHFAAAGGRHRVDHVPCRHESPQEALSAVGPPARLNPRSIRVHPSIAVPVPGTGRPPPGWLLPSTSAYSPNRSRCPAPAPAAPPPPDAAYGTPPSDRRSAPPIVGRSAPRLPLAPSPACSRRTVDRLPDGTDI